MRMPAMIKEDNLSLPPLQSKKGIVCIKCGVTPEIVNDKKLYMQWMAGRRADELVSKMMGS